MQAIHLMPLAYDFLHGKVQDNALYQEARQDKDAEPASFYMDESGKPWGYWRPQEDLPKNLLNVIQVEGPIVKYGSSFSYGTEDYERMIKMAEANPKVIAHVLKMDTGGGSVYGTLTLSQTIRDAEKPVIGFIDSYCCSAGMEIISGSDEVFASHRMDRMGSIGTLISYANLQPAYEEMGIEFHTIYATKSKLKNKLYHDADERKYEGIIKELLDPLNEDFLATMQENMPQIKDLSQSDREWLLSGPDFFAEKGLSFGLIDGIQTFEASLERAFELGEQFQDSQTTTLKVG